MTDDPRPESADASLVARVRSGAPGAVAELYDTYADRIHGFCHSLLRDDADAADATQDTFIKAIERLDQLRNPDRLRPWLYSIARRHALAVYRERGRRADMCGDISSDDVGAPAYDAEPETEEMVALVWDAAGGLEERDQAVLDLTLRHELAADELAEALEVTRDHAYSLAARAKKRLGRAVGALLVARHGRRCDTLRRLVRSWDGVLDPSMRDSINKHVDRCELCQATRSRLLDPAALFAAIPLIGAPAALRADVLSAIATSSATPAATGAEGSADSMGPGSTGLGTAGAGETKGVMAALANTATSVKALVVAVAAVGAVAAGVVVADGPDGGDGGEATATADIVATTAPNGAAAIDGPPAQITAPPQVSPSQLTSTTLIDEGPWSGCETAIALATSIPQLSDPPAPGDIESQQLAIIAFLEHLDDQPDLPPDVRAAVDHRLPLQRQFVTAVAAQGWQLLGGEPGHDPTQGAAVRDALTDACGG